MPTLDEVQNGKGGGDYHGPTNYKTPDGKVHQINKFHQPRNVLDDIHYGCQSRDFIGIQLVGGMGSGKTTLATFLAHNLMKKHPYKVVWIGKEQITNADKIIEELSSEDHIIIFDDVSKALEGLPMDRKKKIIQAFLEIRHMRGKQNARKVISIVNVHHFYAWEKTWRMQNVFSIFTEITNQEMIKVIKDQVNPRDFHYVDKFSKLSYQMFFKNKFDLQIAPKTTRTFITNHPFRMALVTYAGRLKFMLYHLDKCALCERTADSGKTLVSAKHLVDVALEKYGASMSTIMKLECMSRGFKRAVSKKYYCAHQDFYALMGKYSVSWEDLAKELENRSSYPKRTWNREKNIANMRNSPPKEQVEFIDAVISGNLKQKPSNNIALDNEDED